MFKIKIKKNVKIKCAFLLFSVYIFIDFERRTDFSNAGEKDPQADNKGSLDSFELHGDENGASFCMLAVGGHLRAGGLG